MCYYSPSRIVGIAQRRGHTVSALVNFIRHRMKVLEINQAKVAAIAEISESSLSYILTKKPKKEGDQVRPEPDTIKGLAKAIEVHPSVLTFLLGYPTEPIPDIDERLYELARQLLGAPWLAERIGDFLRLPRSEFDELMRYLDFHRPSPPDADQSNP